MQLIFASAKVKFVNKQAIKVTKNFEIMSKNQNLIAKKRINSDNKYFNYRKLEYWRQNCILLNYYTKKSKLDKSSSFKQQKVK